MCELIMCKTPNMKYERERERERESKNLPIFLLAPSNPQDYSGFWKTLFKLTVFFVEKIIFPHIQKTKLFVFASPEVSGDEAIYG